jgi:probable HAF family extracellular repeat protein
MADLADGESRIFLYRNGKMEDLGFPGIPYAINNQGQIVGGGYLPGSQGRFAGFLYDHGRIRDLGTLGGAEALAYGINDSGVVVGALSLQPERAFVYVDGEMFDLNTLLVNNISATLVGALGVNNAGQIIAVGGPGGVLADSYILTPVPAAGGTD